MTQDQKEELLPLLRELLEEERSQSKKKSAMMRRVWDARQEALGSFGKTERDRIYMAYQVRGSIGTLLRAVYNAKNVMRLPEGQEEEIAAFVDDVLARMRKAREKWEGERNEKQGKDPAAP